jgi:hypothetical protein
MITGALAFFAASLFLPFADGAEIFGVMAGFTVLCTSFYTPLSFLTGLAYVAAPLSLLVAKPSPRLAAILVALGSLLPIWVLATEGLYITASLGRILKTGCICLLLADVLMLAAWIVTMRVAGAERV